MSEYVNDGKSALWDPKEGAPPTAPILKGNVYAHRDIQKGEKLDIAYWKNDKYVKGGTHPRLRGKLSDAYGTAPKQQESPPPIEPTPADLDDPMDW